MFRDSLPGLDKVFRTDVTPPKVILVTGPPGSMKTSFVYSLMSRHLNHANAFGLYTTLEEAAESHLRNMESLGVAVTPNVRISDFTDLREVDELMVDPEDTTDYLAFIEKMVAHQRKKEGDRFRIFALDSLGALYSLMPDRRDMRKKMFYFFKVLRDHGLFSFVIMERSLGAEPMLLGNEGFLVDGIILLGLDRSRGKLTRYLQVEKMRACEHSMEKHALVVGTDGLQVLGPIFDLGSG